MNNWMKKYYKGMRGKIEKIEISPNKNIKKWNQRARIFIQNRKEKNREGKKLRNHSPKCWKLKKRSFSLIIWFSLWLIQRALLCLFFSLSLCLSPYVSLSLPPSLSHSLTPFLSLPLSLLHYSLFLSLTSMKCFLASAA